MTRSFNDMTFEWALRERLDDQRYFDVVGERADKAHEKQLKMVKSYLQVKGTPVKLRCEKVKAGDPAFATAQAVAWRMAADGDQIGESLTLALGVLRRWLGSRRGGGPGHDSDGPPSLRLHPQAAAHAHTAAADAANRMLVETGGSSSGDDDFLRQQIAAARLPARPGEI